MSAIPACPAYDDRALGVAHALASVDCRIDGLVASGYARLFGANGAFGAVLTVLLTLYVAAIAIGLMTGRTRLSLSGMAPKLVSIGLVLTFATSWPAYHAVIYDLLVGGPEQIATALAGGGGSAPGFAARLDLLLDRFADLARVLGDDTPGASKALGPMAGPQMASSLIWLSGMMILLASAGALVLTRIVLALLLAIGPVFVVLGLFRQTRGLMEGWLRTSLLFALAPTPTVLVGSAAIALLGPLVDAIADDPAGAVSDLRPVLELFLGSVVYVLLVAMLGWTAASLVRGWRIGRGEADAAPAPSADSLPSPHAAPSSGGSATNEMPADARVGGMIVALSRESTQEAAPVSVRVEQAAASRQEPAFGPAPASSASQRRTEGLGQGLRPAARSNGIAGAMR